MFKRPFKTRTNCQLKNSEKKKLLLRIKQHLPLLNEDDVLFNAKEPMNTVKVTTYSQKHVNIYVHRSTPVFFEFEDVVYPTIFTLWRLPHLLYTFKTRDFVVSKLYNGADLMLPGVIFSSKSSSNTNMLAVGRPAGVCTPSNFACVAVGLCMIDYKDISGGVKSGRALRVLHTFGDELEKMIDVVPTLPIIPHTELVSSMPVSKHEEITPVNEISLEVGDLVLQSNPQVEENNPNDAMNQDPSPSQGNDDTENQPSLESLTKEGTKESNDGNDSAYDMDELADYCLLKSLTSKSLEFPILTNLFYSNFMLNCVPEGLELNIKKTKHKKLSNMLKNMVNGGVLAVEDNKGVLSITNVNRDHPIFQGIHRRYAMFDSMKRATPSTTEDNVLEKVEEIKEELVVNTLVLPLMKDTGIKRQDVISATKMREIIVTYAKKTGLTPPNSQTVVLDPLLSDILLTRKTTMPWGDLVSTIINKMPTCYTIKTSSGRKIFGKGKLPSIDITTATRSGNKSVTMVNNLEKYGINVNEFARHCQHALAASTTTHPTPSGVQFQVQGSQKAMICAMLVDRYNIPQRLIPGFVDKSKGKKSRK